MNVHAAASLVLLVALGSACGRAAESDELARQPEPPPDETSAGGEGGAGGGDAIPEGQTAACRRYVDCIAAVRPSMLSEVEESVGDDGSCWDGSDATRAACDEGCADALAEEAAARPDEARCHECAADSDCPEDRPICTGAADTAGHTCVECREDGDCGTGRCHASACVPDDGSSCLEQTASQLTSLGFDRACVDACLADLETSCTAEVLCCMRSDGPAACGPDQACIEETCAASAGCVESLRSAGTCVEEDCRPEPVPECDR